MVIMEWNTKIKTNLKIKTMKMKKMIILTNILKRMKKMEKWLCLQIMKKSKVLKVLVIVNCREEQTKEPESDLHQNNW